jgi:RNA ligase
LADNLNSDTTRPPSDLGRRTLPNPQKTSKPLNAKAYGSIGHLPRSRVGPGDWHVNEGMARILCEKPRKGDRIVVREKLDGACMSAANVAGAIHALGRAGYPALSAPYEHLRLFDEYVRRRQDIFTALLGPGERIVGEWLTVAHGTIYDASHPGYAPFVAFDIFRGIERVCTDEFSRRCAAADILTAKTIHDAEEALSIEDALGLLGAFGHHGATEPVEGAVWRVERQDKIEFLAKYVRPDKIDGKYLPGTNGNVTDGKSIWLWRE